MSLCHTSYDNFPANNFSVFLSLFILWERQRERERERERQRQRQSTRAGEGQRERERERIPRRLCIVSTESNMGLKPMNHEIMTWAKVKSWTVNWLSHPGAPPIIFLMCACHFSHQQIVCFLPPESRLPWNLLWQVQSGINDTVPVIGLALKEPDNFQLRSLGTQPPCYREVQAILLKKGATWRGSGRE